MENSFQSDFSTIDNRKDNYYNLAKNMKFVSLFIIIYGAISTLSIVGALVGIPIIFAGLKLRDASIAIYNYLHSNLQHDLDNAVEKQARAFWILKILILVTILFYIFVILILIIFILPYLRNLSMFQV
mgnify:CR=1 FL=1